jgi:hypothetical protein
MLQQEVSRNLGLVLLDVMTGEVKPFDALPQIASRDNIVWSSDGQEIVFSTAPGPPPHSERFSYGLFFMDSNGSVHRTIWGDPDLPFGQFAWSPEGDRILFTSNGNLYTLDLGTETVELFMKSAESVDWKDPSRFQFGVSPHSKFETTWGEIRKP